MKFSQKKSFSPYVLHTLRWCMLGGILFFYAWLDFRRYFPPFSLTIQLLVVLLLTIWGVAKIIHRQHLIRSPLTSPLVFLLITTTLSTFFSIDMRRSFDGLLMTLTLVLFFFVFCDLLLAGWNPQIFIHTILCMATLASGFGLWITVDYYRDWWLMRVPEYPTFPLPYRLFGVTDHPNFLAAMVNLALPFAVIRLALAKTFSLRLFWGFLLALFETVLFLTHSRGGWLACACASTIIVIWLLLRVQTPWHTPITSWLRHTWRIWVMTGLYVGLFLLLHQISKMLLPETDVTFHGGATIQSATSQRMALWEVAVQMFLSYPIFGSGPLTYGHAFARDMHVGRLWLPSYAHNLFLEMLATQGIAGAGALLWIWWTGFLALTRYWWRIWKPSLSPHLSIDSSAERAEKEALLIGVCAVLSGYVTHSLVDVIGKMAVNDLGIVLFTALGLHALGALQHEQRPLPRWMGAVLVVPIVLVFILIRYGAAQEAMFQALVSSLKNDWVTAAHEMDKATAEDPSFGFYFGQRGFAYSVLALPIALPNNPDALARALEDYAIAYQIAPPYVPNMLNTMIVLEQAGNPQQARAILEQTVALEQSYFWALPALLLADQYALEGKTIEAHKLFAIAFQRESQARDMVACRRSVACRNAAVQIQATFDPIQQTHEEVQRLLAQKRINQALATLKRIPVGDANPLPWLDRANVHLALGQTAQTQYALRMANHLLSGRNPLFTNVLVYAALTHAAVAQQQGQINQAIAALEQVARPQITREGYGYGIFRRVGLPGEFTPRLDLLQRTAGDLEIYRQLVQLYTKHNRPEDSLWAQKQFDALAALLEQGK